MEQPSLSVPASREIIESNFDITTPIKFEVNDTAIAALSEKYKDFPTDLTVKKNYEFVKKAVAECRKSRTSVESQRKGWKQGVLEYGRMIDSAAKGVKEEILAIETPMKELKTEFDTSKEIAKREAIRKEEERVDRIQERIANIKALPATHISSSSADIQKELCWLSGENPEEWADEFTDKATAVILETSTKLDELFTMREQAENAERLEAERKAKEAEEDKKRAEDNKKKEAELAAQQKEIADQKAEIARQQKEIDFAKAMAAQEKKDAKERKEREKRETKRREEQEAVRKIEQEKIEKEEAKRLEAAKKHDADNCKRTVKGMATFETSELLLDAIREGKFRNIKWVA